MAAFENLIDLRLAVSDQVSNRAISDVFPMLVSLAESDLNSRLRTRYQVVDATLTFEDGVSPIPPDFMEMISARDKRGCEIHPAYEADGFNFTIPGFSGDITIKYYACLPTLTKSPTATNWLLKRWPTVYLYGVGLQAAKFLKDEELAVKIDQLYSFALASMQSDDYRSRWSNQVVRVQGMTP